LCWGTHGSGLILVRYTFEEAFPAFSGVAVQEASSMLGHIARLVLTHFKLFDASWEQSIQSTRAAGLLAAAQHDFDEIVAKGEGEQ
jgi:hypothetical protein